MRRTIEVGDEVVYTPAWLHSTGQTRDDIARYRGVVKTIEVVGEQVLARVGSWTLDGMLVTEDELGTPWEPLVNILNIARPMTARAIDIPLWAAAMMAGGKIDHHTREAIDRDRARMKELDEKILLEYRTERK